MKSLLTLSAILILYSLDLFAQWQPDVRLTNDPANSNTSINHAWSMTTSGSVVHVVWWDDRDGNYEIYYKRSTDGGISWGTDTQLTNNSATSRYPSVSVFGSVVHVVWEDDRDGNYEIYYKRSTDGGISWEADTRLTNNSAYSLNPSGAVSGSDVYVVWSEDRDGNNEIYFKRSTNDGVSWEADTRLTNNSADSYYSSVSVSGSVVLVLWNDNRDANYEIYCKRSTDGGISWGTDTRLTDNSAFSRYPSVSVSGSVAHVVWEDFRDANFDTYYKRSTDGGISWGTDKRLTIDSADSYHPTVSVSGSSADGGVHVVWQDNRDGNSEIYYKRSTDAGISWESDIRLTNDFSTSVKVSLSISGQVVHVVWQDNRDGNYEIYYKRNPTGNVTGIENISLEFPEKFMLEQNYPNPFNPSTTIHFSVPTSEFVTLKVFDVLGNEVATLVNEEQPAGNYEIEFSPAGLSSGIYFYKLHAGSFVETKKMILIR